MLVLLPEDKKPGFFFLGLFMDLLSVDIQFHLLTESVADPQQIGTSVDELWTVHGRVDTVQSLFSQDFEDISLVSLNPWTRSSSSHPLPPQSVGTIVNGETRLISADNHVPIGETSWRWGFYLHSYHRVFVLTSVVTQEFRQVPCEYLSFCVSFPSPACPILLYLQVQGYNWKPLMVPLWIPMVPTVWLCSSVLDILIGFFCRQKFLCQSLDQISYVTIVSWFIFQVLASLTPQPWNLSRPFCLAHSTAAKISTQLFSLPLIQT